MLGDDIGNTTHYTYNYYYFHDLDFNIVLEN